MSAVENKDPLTIIHGDALSSLREMESESVQTCITSPPYWGLRSYGTEPVVWGGDPECVHTWGAEVPGSNRGGSGPNGKNGYGETYGRDQARGNQCECGAWRGELGLEPTPEMYVAHLVEIFREVKRVLRADATLWLNLGDSYAGSGKGGNPESGKQPTNRGSQTVGVLYGKVGESARRSAVANVTRRSYEIGLKPKDLCMIPARVALALQADGWYLRSDIIWAKQNCMPESVTDRPTRAHEYIFLLTKSARYYYNHEAIKEPCIWDIDGNGTEARKARQRTDTKSMPTAERNGLRPLKRDASPRTDRNENNGRGFTPKADKQRGHSRRHAGFNDRWDQMEREEQCTGLRNKRSVWTVAPAIFPEAHFATYPPKLIEPCVLAGSRPSDAVLDPFAGSGTTGKVAIELGRKAILIEPKAEYIEMIKRRCQTTIGLPLAI